MSAAGALAVPAADRRLRKFAYVLAMQLVCAFDESGTHRGSPLICIAGYLMEKQQAIALRREWNEVLNSKDWEHTLPYFHMTDCAPDPGNGVFAGISKSHRTQIVSRMIGIIKHRTILGVAVTLDVRDYDRILAGHPFYPDPYVLVAHTVLSGVRQFIDANKPEVTEAGYFFEAGHESERAADALMHLLFQREKIRKMYRYAGHFFINKRGNPIVQAADLIAWHWAKDRKNMIEGRPRRRDLISLLAHRHLGTHIEPDLLKNLATTREPILEHLQAMYGKESPS